MSLHHRIAFASVYAMRPALARELLELCGSEEEFFAMEETRLRYLTQSRARIYSADYRRQLLERAATEVRFVEGNRIRPLYFLDDDYPRRLADCEDAPLLIYTLGNLDLNAARMVGIVGTRHATPYGLEWTRKLVADLAATTEGIVIVSGLAYGIDIAAHRAALAAGIPTVGVMATGLQTVYPADHRSDAARMVSEGGMLITEYAHTEPIHKGNFVARNRIVAGLCDCLVVAESAAKGGALITAGIASDYGRDVLALPGRVGDTYSAGCNRLIASGAAALISGADDLCAAMGWPRRSDQAAEAPELPLELNPQEASVVDFLEKNDDATLPQLIAATGTPVGPLTSMLIDMEFRGLVISLPGGRYRRT